MLNTPLTAAACPVRTMSLRVVGSSVKLLVCAAPPNAAGSVDVNVPTASSASAAFVPLTTVVVTVVVWSTAKTRSASSMVV